MTPIFRKELRAGIPFACLMVLVRIVEEISGWVTGYPDIYSLGDMIGQGGGSLEGPLIYFLLCFAYGYGLLIREKDEGTLEFLDALPASRTQIYLGKILAGCVIVAAMPLTWNTTLLVHGWLGRDSLETSLYLFDSFWTFLVEWFAGIVYLGIAVALSFLRRFAFLVLALLFLGYLKLSTMDLSWVRWLNILEVFDYTYYGSHPVPPWGKIAVAGAIGIAGFLAAYFAYLAQGDRMGRVAGALDRRGCLKPLLAAGAVSVVLVWLGIFIYYIVKSGPDYDPDAEREVQVVYESWETSRASGGGYDFIYPANLEHRAEGLIELAGETHRQVREFLGVPQVDGTIVANLGSNDPHFA
ncbi:MAG: ABC transporter permease subunit [Verrucomicrobiales bacterium]